jgi:pimeloyl-ACP methyl ester carboxylesterase
MPGLTQEVAVQTHDGRSLHVRVAGDGRRVVVVHLGTPNAGPLHDPWVKDALERGLTLITYDRPGYGRSTRHEGRTIADCASDVLAMSEALGFSRCAAWGFSGGGPHALACAARLDRLVAAAATIGSPAPFDAPDLDYFAGKSDAAREDHELFVSDRPEWERQGEEQRIELLALSYEEQLEQWSASLPEVEVACLRGEFGRWLHGAMQSAVAASVDGWTDEDIALHAPWGFDPAAISIPVKIWHGAQDAFVPFAHGQWLAKTIPNAEAELSPNDAHGTVVADRIAEVHTWLTHYV